MRIGTTTLDGAGDRAAEGRGRRSLANVLLCLPHAVISLLVLLRHEPWRDETHAWLLARGPASWTDLLVLVREGEVSPPLWHLLLRLVSMATDQFMAVSLLHWVIMVAAVALLVWFSPFRWYEKLLISLGYLLLFEYTVIARHYGLSVLCVFAVLALYTRGRDTRLAECLVLAVLAQTNVCGTLLAAALWAVLWAQTRHRAWLGHAAVALSIAASCFYLSGEASAVMESGDLVKPAAGWGDTGLMLGNAMLRAALQVPSQKFWQPAALLIQRGPAVALSVLCGVLLLWAAPKRGLGGAVCWVSTACLFVLYMAIGETANIRHHGFLYVALLSGLWLERAAPTAGPVRWFDRGRRGAFWLILLGAAWSAGWMVKTDWTCTYSRARAMARQLLDRSAQWEGPVLWATWGSSGCEGMLAFLPRERAEFYSLELRRPYRYLVHGREWKAADPNTHPRSEDDVAKDFLAEFIRGDYRHAFLLIPAESFHLQISPQMLLVPVLEKGPSCLVVADERFYLHELRSVPRFGGGRAP